MELLNNSPPAKPGAIILAAGASSRMGQHKPFLKLNGRTMLEMSIQALLGAGASDIVVVTGRNAKETSQYARLHGARAVENLNYMFTDMLGSLRLGLGELEPEGPFYVLPCDMPVIRPATLGLLSTALKATDAQAAIPVEDGQRGHPPMFSAECKAGIIGYEGEGGLSGYIGTLSAVATVEAGDPACLMDADTQDEYSLMASYAKDNCGVGRDELLKIIIDAGTTQEQLKSMEKAERKASAIALLLIAEGIPVDLGLLETVSMLCLMPMAKEIAIAYGYRKVSKLLSMIGGMGPIEAMAASTAKMIVSGEAEGGEKDVIKSFVKFASEQYKRGAL